MIKVLFCVFGFFVSAVSVSFFMLVIEVSSGLVVCAGYRLKPLFILFFFSFLCGSSFSHIFISFPSRTLTWISCC